MATVLDTFITRFGFETDKTGLDDAKKGLGDFKASAIKIAAAVGSIIAGGFFIKAAADAADGRRWQERLQNENPASSVRP